MDDPTCVSLFSGIGGLDHGLHRAGFRHLAFCESEPYRRDVLAARWPGVPVYDDVAGVAREPEWRTELSGRDSRDSRCGTEPQLPVDLLTGGFPCQDLSVAGQRRGLDGDRSGLFFEFARIAGSLRPRWLLVENVPGLLSSNGGRDFGTVVGTLADIGYGVAWRVLDSRFFGVPQRRRRVFIVGTLADGDPRAAAERAGQVLAVGTRCQGHPATRGEAREDLAGTLGGGAGKRGWAQDTERMTFIPQVAHSLMSHGGNDKHDTTLQTYVADTVTAFAAKGGGGGSFSEENISPTLSAHGDEEGGQPPAIAFAQNQRDEQLVETDYAHQLTGGGGKPGEGYAAVREGASVRRLMPVECERLQALPDGWTDLGGTADSKRYAALGDAVTSSVAEWIGRRLVAA